MIPSDELTELARSLIRADGAGQAIMLCPVSAESGATTVAAALAEAAGGILAKGGAGAEPVWLFDLDFSANVQAARTRLNGAVYSGDLCRERFWRAEPEGVSRLALRKRTDHDVLVSVFQREPGRVRRVVFQRAPGYWDRVRAACRLAVVDTPHGSPAMNSIAPDMDGVILVADARKDFEAESERAARRIVTAGGRVLGVVVNRVDAASEARSA
jgi:hypothetical protein